MLDLIRQGLTQLGVLAANPLSFVIVAVLTVIWYFAERHSLDWHGMATVATLFVALLIHRTAHRDTQAVQAKLDALIRALPEASNAVAAIDKKEPEEIQRHRDGTSVNRRT